MVQFDAVNEKKSTIQYVGRSASSCLETSYRSLGLSGNHDKSHPESGPSLPCNNNNQTEISVSCIICTCDSSTSRPQVQDETYYF